MSEFVAIAGALSSLKTATEIVKLIRESDVSLEKAELKLKLAELVGALADAKMQLSEIQGELSEKDAELRRLKETLETKGKVVRYLDAVYFQDSNGEAIGEPHCLGCWSDKNKLRLLAQEHTDHSTHVCTSCKHKYSRRLTPRDALAARRAKA